MKKFRGRTCAALAGLLLTTPAWGDVGAEMEAEADVGAQMSAEGEGEAKAEGEGEAKAGGETAAAKPAEAPAQAGDQFVAPSGLNGAGLSLSPAQKGRFWGELGFTTNSTYLVVSPILGGGYKIMEKLELELVVPMAFVDFDVGIDSDSAFKIGNIYAGANYLGGSGELKYKVGGGLGLPTSSVSDVLGGIPYGAAAGIRGLQEWYLWAPENMSMNGIARIEHGSKVVLTGDAALSVYFPIGDAGGEDNEVSFTLAPGVGAWLGDSALLGGRLLFFYGSVFDDHVQLGVEPYFRYNLGESAFLNTRFTLNIDEPAGFSFDDGRFWGWHLGGGASF